MFILEFTFIFFLLIQLIVGYFARKEGGEKTFLLRSAHFLFQKLFARFIIKTNTYIKVQKNIGSLNPGKDFDQLIRKYYIKKIHLSYCLILVGNILALIISFSIRNNNQLIDEKMVPKNNWEQGNYSLDLSVTAENTEIKPRDITIVIEPKSLNEKEVRELANEVFIKLRTYILGENHSLSQVTETLNLVLQMDNYPFIINWQSDKPSLIKTNGRINNHEIQASETVKLTALLHYQDMWVEYHFSEDIYVNVLPYLIAGTDGWEKAIIAAVKANQYDNAFNDFFYLPEKINGITVRWKELKIPDGLYLWLMVFIAAFIAFASQDQDLMKKVTNRNQQIDRDYPELIRKLTLYLGAGMTLRGAWKRVAGDYKETKEKAHGKQNRFLFEEMLYSVRELDNGISEREVYERFGRRVGIVKYRKLMGLLCNHLEKGNKNLLQVLREEMELALEDRKKTARAIGEEMSTKLLLPMMLMLLIVMVMIMVPAFQML